MRNTFFRAESEVTPANLGEAIQQAIEIEIAVCSFGFDSTKRIPKYIAGATNNKKQYFDERTVILEITWIS